MSLLAMNTMNNAPTTPMACSHKGWRCSKPAKPQPTTANNSVNPMVAPDTTAHARRVPHCAAVAMMSMFTGPGEIDMLSAKPNIAIQIL